MDHEQRIINNRKAPKNNKIWILGAVALAFIVLAFGGSYFTSHQINKTADTHQSSAGRPSDGKPNLIQEQQDDKSARGPSTTGQNTPTVPPASR